MKKKFLGKVLMMASFVAILGGFSSCKDYSEDRYSDLLGKLENHDTSLTEALDEQERNLLNKIEELKKEQQACKEDCSKKMSELDSKWDNELAAEVAILIAEDSVLQAQIDSIVMIMGVVDTTKGTIAEQLAALNRFVEDPVAWSDDLKDVVKDATDARNQATLNAIAIQKLDSIVNANDSVAFGNIDSLAKELDKVRAKAQENLDSAISYTNDQVAALRGEYIETIGDLEHKMDSVDSLMSARLDSLKVRVDTLEKQVSKNTNDIEVLTGRLNKLVTSVIIQGTKNRVMGSIATPFNTRSNILAAYYGNVGSAGLAFPTELARYYVDNSDVKLTSKDIEMLGDGVDAIESPAGAVLGGEAGNAGTLYMTINPNTVVFEGLSFDLVNSQDVPSGAVLDGVVLSDEVLSFGMTRASSNGFYEAKATIPTESLDALRFKMNFGEIKDVAKDIIDGNGVDINKLANTVANTMSSFVMDANGLKVSWTDSVGEHSTYSQYGVAVTSVKPLSYSFGKDFNYTKVPGIDRIESFIGKVADKAKNAINKVDFNIKTVEIKSISLPEYQGKKTLEVIIDIPAQSAYDSNGNYIGETKEYVDTVYVDIEEVIDELYGGVQDSFDDVNAMLEDLDGMMDEINALLQQGKDLQASANNSVDKLQSKLTEYLNKFNNKFCNLINSTNKALRPVLLVRTTDGFHKISQAKNNPTVITGTELDLIPTSYTLEFLAPAYKKLVGVTNVYKGSANAQANDAECKAALDKVNGNVAKIMSGDTYRVSATFEPGYVYEIVYTAVDFFGMVDAKKFYITVK